jgi:hypothetical protein
MSENAQIETGSNADPKAPGDPGGESVLGDSTFSGPPNPGSNDALKIGCLCPVLDNAHGKGYMCMEGVFVYREGCPVHSANKENPNSEN